jgi:hypothetical protein
MKPKPTPTFSWEEMDALRTTGGVADDPIPDGAIDSRQYAARYNLTSRGASYQLDRMVQKGLLTSGMGHSATNRPVKFYWKPLP